MAICIPESDKDFVTLGERKVFALLKRLPDTCLVYYELNVDQRRRLRPDFVVIDINRGVTVFEVKDYGIDTIIKTTPNTIEYASKENTTEEDQNPEKKMNTYLDAIAGKLSSQGVLCDNKGRLDIDFCGYIVFPNMTKSEFYEIPQLQNVINPDIVLFRDDIKTPELFLDKYNKMHVLLDTHLPQNKWNAIRVALFPELAIPSSEQWFAVKKIKGPVVSVDKNEYEYGLDVYQEQVAKSLGSGPRSLQGIAGTGKTLILLFHAKLSSANALALGKHPRILFLCWNISLAQYMRHAYKAIQIPNAGDIEIVYFCGFARRLLKPFGIQFPNPRGGDFEAKLTMALSQVRVVPSFKYDAIYIDEAQDFQKEWIKFIFENLLKGDPSDRSLIVTGDYAQHIYKHRDFVEISGFTWKSIGIPMVGRTKTLKKIYRNSARVWSFAAAFMGDIYKYYEDDKETKIEFAPKRGFDPLLVDCSSIEEQVDKAVEIISRLAENGYSPRNAMVLYRWPVYRGYEFIKDLKSKLEKKNIHSQWISENNEKKATFDMAEDSVKISTAHSAKGMDAPVVIILGAEKFGADDESIDDEEKLLYVALTRAREFLAILYTGNTGMIPRLTIAMTEYKKYRKQILELEETAKNIFLT